VVINKIHKNDLKEHLISKEWANGGTRIMIVNDTKALNHSITEKFQLDIWVMIRTPPPPHPPKKLLDTPLPRS